MFKFFYLIIGGKKMTLRSTAILTCTLLLILSTPHLARSIPMLEFAGVPATVEINTTFSVDVVLSGMGDFDTLSTFDFDINFNPEVLVISGVLFGEGLADQMDPFGGSIQTAEDKGNGAYNFSEFSEVFPDWITWNSFFADQFDGSNSLTLLTLDITALAVGPSDLTISGPVNSSGLPILGDENGWGIEAAIQSSSVTVTPVPEPATFLLFGVGLAGLATLRRRSSSLQKTAD
ncbi:MAG: PEP-CTERM sorting domain-containing protein [Desulfobulbaceae bacterium]|nr:PEP-CTERM sorting domain-containing protein [Desulfobulbaceae bacterium]